MNTPALHPRAILRPAHAPGFTLIELLTVIAIVGILAAIIIPVVGKVRQTALKSDCAANLRQAGQATALYATDNKGFYPRAYTNVSGVETYWREVLVRGGYFGLPNVGLTDNRPQSNWHASHFTYLTCKAHRQAVPIVNASDEWLRPSYSMNGTLASGQPGSWRPRMESYTTPSRLAYIADGPPPSGASGVVINAALWSGSWKPDASRAHGGTANILFFDGHIESRRDQDIPASHTGSAAASLFWNGY